MATIQGVYLALFERPADPAGLAFFNNATQNGQNLNAIGDLAGQREYLDRFVGQNNEQIVRSIFRSLFNREGEQAGVDFFVGRLTRGEIGINQIAINILDGAQNQDLAILNNKLAAANAFTAAIDTQAEISGYVGDAAAARARTFISNVTTSVPDAAAVANAVAVATGTGGNPAPVAVDDTATTAAGTPLILTAATLLANDTNTPATDTLTITAVGNATGGTVTLAAGSITFTPTAGFTGAAGFDYTVSDGTSTDVGRVAVTVGGTAPPPPPATPFTLTLNADTATAATFNAPLLTSGGGTQVQSLTSADSLTGAGSTAVLNANLNGNPTPVNATVAGVQTLNFTVTTAASTFDASRTTGATRFNDVDSTANLLVQNIQALATVGVTGSSANADANFRFVNTLVAGTTDTATVALNNVGRGSLAPNGIDVNVSGETAGGFETFAVQSTGAANRLQTLTSTIGGQTILRTVNITGDQALRIDGALQDVTTVNATGFTGDLRVTLDATRDVAVTGGSGADFFDFAGGKTNADTVNGGAGRDTLAVNTTANLAAGNNITNVETIRFDGAATGAVDQNLLTGVDSFVFNSTAAITVNNFDVTAPADPFTRGVTLLSTGNVTVNVEGATNPGQTSDIINIQIGLTGPSPGSGLQSAAGANAGGINVNGIENINIRVNADADGQTATGSGAVNTLGFGRVLTLTGGAVNEAFSVDNGTEFGTGGVLERIDASAFLGNLTTGAGTAFANIGLQGNTGAEAIIGGTGNDNLATGGRGAATGDLVTGGAGNDVFFTRGGANSDSTAALPNAGVAVGTFTPAQLNAFTTITDLNLGAADGFVDRVNFADTFNFAGTATVVNATPTALVGATFGAGVNALINNGVLDTGQAASGAALRVGLFTFNNETFLIANEAATAATTYTATDTIVLRVTNASLGSLDAGDILLV